MINNLKTEKDDMQNRDNVKQFMPEECEREYRRIFGVDATFARIEQEQASCMQDSATEE